MRSFASWATIDNAVQQQLDGIAVDQKTKAWKGKRIAVTAFKAAVLDHGMVVQDQRCAWCTLLIGEAGRRTVHRDHVAPSSVYPQWTFTAQNLVLACEYCNGLSVKSHLDTVLSVGATYEESDFHIVHPYLNEPGEHIEFMGEDDESILIVGTSDKGRWTITNLKLDTPELTRLRAADYLHAERSKSLSPHFLDLYERATGRKKAP